MSGIIQPIMKKTPKKKAPFKEKISLTLEMNGAKQETSADSVMELLENIGIEPMKVKTLTKMTFGYQGRNFYRILRIPFMKMLILNDMRRLLLAKTANSALGISANK